jgi:hypothetical protein
MVGTLETLSPIPTPPMGISRPGATLTHPQPPAKAPAATVPITRSRDRTHDADGVRVELSAAASRLTQVAQQAAPQLPAAVEALRTLRQAQGAKAERPLDAVLDKVRDDLVKVFRMFGHNEKESLAAAEAVAGKAREAAAKGPLAAQPAAGGQASTGVSLVFQSVTLQVTGSSGKVQASIEVVRLEASMTTGAALAIGLLPGGQSGLLPGGQGGDSRQVDPLVFDLDGNGVDLTTAENGVLFDMDGDGKRDKTAWVAGGDAMLALDRNGNGQIDDGRELFGEQNGAADGFGELGRFDKDGNGVIDGHDPVFNSLILLHADGGMTRLRDEGITGIRLDIAVPLNAPAEQRVAGGVIAAQSEFSRADGSRGTLADVLFDVKI